MRADAKAHVYVADVEHPVLEPGDQHHLARVLRLRTGDEITVGDGAGRWRSCRFGDELDPVDAVQVEARPEPAVTVAFALTKGERPEWVVQKLTELGVDRIVPFVAARSVVRWDEAKAERQRARLGEIVRQAGMQSRRARLPALEPVAEFDAVAAGDGVALADRAGGPFTLEHPVVLVGPEGGWTDDERERVPVRVALAAEVLRAETAAIAAGAILVALRAGIVRPVTQGD